MKSFFSGGKDWKQFVRQYFDESMADIKLKASYGDPDAEQRKKETSFFKTYLVVIPDESRSYDLWTFLMSCAIIVEMVLVPYTVCLNV